MIILRLVPIHIFEGFRSLDEQFNKEAFHSQLDPLRHLNDLCEEVTNLVVGGRIAYYMGLVGHGSSKGYDKPRVSGPRRLIGIMKYVFENSSSSRDFPIPDDWRIEQYRPYGGVVSVVDRPICNWYPMWDSRPRTGAWSAKFTFQEFSVADDNYVSCHV